MESLAIDAFAEYYRPLDTKSMLIHFLGHSMEAAKRPIVDSTRQSRYVDESLGLADSGPRNRAANLLWTDARFRQPLHIQGKVQQAVLRRGLAGHGECGISFESQIEGGSKPT